ncbi:thioredoxin domain-containing protein [Candidatus Falkowbacteria bacterium]|nr:thioredoxin domain-containing protein [Candidatus Falkowbacteria bacterium]
MYSKLNFKIYGAANSGDLDLIEDNLKSQEGIRAVKLFPAKGHTEIKMEIDAAKITKDQVFDIIKISGDLRIVEQEGIKSKINAEAQKMDISLPTGSPGWFENFLSKNPSKAFFVLGLLVSIFIMSLIANILFGFIWFKSREVQASGPGNLVQNNPAPAPQAPSPGPEAPAVGQIQDFSITKNDHVRGNFDAPITLVEYSDFECPYCGKHFPTLNKILNDYKGQVRLVYKHFPLSFHQNSEKAAEASECASEQGKFWEYHDKLFENQSGGYSIANFKQWANDLNLDTSKFNDCLDSGKFASKVQADLADGQNRGVGGTPATFVNGQLVSGAVPYESFKNVIDQILNNN